MHKWLLLLISSCVYIQLLPCDQKDQPRVAWIASRLNLEPTSPIARTLQESRDLQNNKNPSTELVTACMQTLQGQKPTLEVDHIAQPCIDHHINSLRQLSTPRTITKSRFNICRFLRQFFWCTKKQNAIDHR
ncbi:MAG TPA: hypothetical protein VFF04_00880 [Candidatus Babeliales bacterium]|nr:hypothetical protein [Candidatus Babeliales bacterium]